MGLHRTLRCIAAWMACFAVLLASLAPAVSHAIHAAKSVGPGQHEYCSTEETTTHSSAHSSPPVGGAATPHDSHPQTAEHADHSMPVVWAGNASHASHGPENGLHFEHCPFCLTHAGSFGLAPIISLAVQPATRVALRPELFYRSPQPLFAWASAQPRAPPAVS